MHRTQKTIRVATTVLAILAISAVGWADDSNRNEVRSNLGKDGWRVIWGKNFTEADWGRATKAIAESVASENPGPFLAWFEQTINENFTKIERNLKDVTRRDLERWIVQSLRERKIIIYKGLRIDAGFATYNRWERVVYDEPRTRQVMRRDPITGIKTYVPEFYTERVEKRVPLPNWHQFYIRYQLIASGDSSSGSSGGVSGGHGNTNGGGNGGGGNGSSAAGASRLSWSGSSNLGSTTLKREGQEWVEYQNGRAGARFREQSRDANFVYLYDGSRQLWVALSSTQMLWRQGDHGDWHLIFEGKWNR
jgi:uncharacterized membrane protein YgcG